MQVYANNKKMPKIVPEEKHSFSVGDRVSWGSRGSLRQYSSYCYYRAFGRVTKINQKTIQVLQDEYVEPFSKRRINVKGEPYFLLCLKRPEQLQHEVEEDEVPKYEINLPL